MSTKIESEFPPSTPNDESDGEEECDALQSSCRGDEDYQQLEPKQEIIKSVKADVSGLLARLQSSGALLKKPKQEYHCFNCDIDFEDWENLENHLINHVSLPSVVLDKLPSDDEDLPPSGDENWTDEEEAPAPAKPSAAKTPQKIDISQILKKTGLSLKKPVAEANSSNSALDKLSGLGFTIKKNFTPIKKEKQDNEPEKQNDVMQKLGKLGGIKLKLKSDGNNTNSFKVVNGLKDFKASDDEDEGSGNEEDKDDQESNDELDRSGENDGENDSDEHQSGTKRHSSESNDSEKAKKKVPNLPKGVQAKLIPKKEPVTISKGTPLKVEQEETTKAKPGRPAVKQTPKRGINNHVASKEPPKLNALVTRRQSQVEHKEPSPAVTPDRRQSNERVDNVVVKQEVADNVTGAPQSSDVPIFSGQIKSERSTPPLSERSTPILAKVKSEPDASVPSANTQPLFSYQDTNASTPTTPLLPVTKTEDTGITVIEINGDSNDEDDDCCVVSTTPAPVIKPKVEKSPPPAYPNSSTYSTPQTNYQSSAPTLSSRLSSAPSTEKQHNFNWNAPDTKPPLDMLEKSADDIFESLLSTATKKENMLDASEYVSLDSLGPQHTCEICNTRFTTLSLLDEHRRVTGHCSSIITASPSTTLMPYNHSSSILSSLLPVKQLAEQVGKLSTISGSGPGFTHQQNVMINIQAYPGGGGVMVPPQPYNAYAGGQNMPGNYGQAPNNMYGAPGAQAMPNQYPGTNYMGQGYSQYPQMSKSGYPGTLPPNSYSMASSPYSSASPLQSMQQSVYGQPPMMNQPGAMGPPGSSPSHSYASAVSPGGAMKAQPGSGIKIQNIQTFPPGQVIGQSGVGQTISSGELGPGHTITGQGPGQMSGPTPIRMAAGANISGPRPRMPSVRGQRPTIRPGIQVHGQVRGGKIGPRMPLKRPGAMVGGPGQKRRPDMLLPGKHDNEDCQVMALQKQRDGLPLIHSVQGAKDKLNIGSQISITKKANPVNKEANAMANVLASRGISVKQKQKSRSPSPERPLPHIPNLGAGVSIKHTSKSSKFSIPEAKVGTGMFSCKICKKMFMNQTSLQVHMSNAHPQTTSKIPMFKCDECPASYPKSLQLQHHKRVFHNVAGPNRELGLPVVDLSQEDNLKRLSSLGIYSFIPLANREQANGCFGIPVISVHNMQNGLTSSLQALGADGLLSLGPLKPLPNS
ncbi:uncharacterized protein LOC120637635 [Pararge aegeria]|uniref:Jg11351 protein n=3 Tax=Pararge aegeria TaxID=116150 RepID=A0A8S4RLN6_9NEOP|nr:uncharacterized protein LOC120637635 [Pararge aegeria]CAH2237674.1 jg11351 [Pararge aegeria aegeria]